MKKVYEEGFKKIPGSSDCPEFDYSVELEVVKTYYMNTRGRDLADAMKKLYAKLDAMNEQPTWAGLEKNEDDTLIKHEVKELNLISYDDTLY